MLAKEDKQINKDLVQSSSKETKFVYTSICEPRGKTKKSIHCKQVIFFANQVSQILKAKLSFRG